MSLQTAYYTQPYAAPTGTTGAISTGGFVPSVPSYAPSMTQLPSLPQPYLGNTTLPSNGQGITPIPEVPNPWQIAPGVMGGSGKAPAYTLAQSVPVSPNLPAIPPTPDIPPPQLVAPWLYFQRPLTPQGYQNPSGMNGLNGLNGQNGQGTQPPQGQQPPVPPQQPPQTPPQQPPQQPPQPKAPTAELGAGGLDDATIRSLNDQLNNPSEDVRADAVMTLYKILEANPSLSDNPVYTPYVNAFMEKIMKDPSPLVRGGGELILRMGHVPNPSDPVRKQLDDLSKISGLTGEGEEVNSILGGLKSGTLKKSPPPAPAPTPAPQNGQGAQQPNQPGQPPTPNGGQAPNQPGAMQPPGQQPGYPQGQGEAPQAPQTMGYQQPPQNPAPYTPQQQPMGGFQQNYGMPQQPMTGYAQQGYGAPPPNPYSTQQPMTGYGSTVQPGGMPYNGGRLNVMSPQQQAMPMSGFPPQSGQRLNIQEGYR